MITNRADYERYLANIKETAPSVIRMRLPVDEPVYKIDWNTRKVSAPPFIGVEGDHKAEFVFFEMDRFYDMMDLADTVGLVIFKNAKNEEYCQIIPYYDTYSITGKIIFPWSIQAPAALYTGTVSFSFKFFKVDPTSKKLLYELNTLIATTKVLKGWINISGEEHTYNLITTENILAEESTLEDINRILAAGKYLQLYWLEADRIPFEPTPGPYDGGDVLDPALPEP